ncbi:hypothetical protein EDD11_004215 [Mortierella claussenii]|nr:hypothetical protein EDD11_004215 [Mortierella claussenii]
MKALEVLPKLGRRKVLVNGKPCGRNELIADFIFQQTQKVRDRKQVSSHIQVLKNTRKHDPAFLRLLMDGGDGDEEIEMTGPSNNGYASLSLSPIMISPSTQYDRSEQPIFDDRGQHISDASPSGAATAGGLNSLTGTDYHGYSVAHSQFRPPYKQQHSQENPPHARITSFSASDVGSDHMLVLSEDPESHSDSAPSIYQHSVTTPDSAVSLSSEMGMKEPVVMLKQENIEDSYRRSADGFGPSSFYGKDKVIRNPSAKPHQRSRSSSSSSSVTYPFWPTDFGLYLQYPVLSPDGISNSTGQQQQQQQQQQQRQQRQYLARANDLRPSRMRTINIHQLQPEKFPNLYDLYEKASSAWSCPFVFLKVGMDLNLELDGTFENTCLFESNVKGGEKPTTTTSNSHGDTNERRWSTVRCLTLIYSFGAKVLESTEVKQVKETGDEQKLIYSFEFVNQFFNAFLTGIRTLETMEEVEVALCNLSLVQIYEEVEATADARIEDPHQHHHHPLAATGAIGGVEAGGTGTGPVASGSPSPLLVMAFEFEKGRGTVLPYHVVDGSDMLETLMC